MKPVFGPLALALCLGLACGPAIAAGTVVFHDDFNGSQLDTTHWGIATWTLGRTQLGNVPKVANGVARLRFDTDGFTGTEMFTKTNYPLGHGVEFEARLRMANLPSGLVTALFTYNTQNALSDEIDIECLSKQINASLHGLPMLLSTWNDWDEAHPAYGDGIHNASKSVVVPRLDANVFHTYTIRWLPDHTEWLVDGVLVSSSTLAHPDLAMPLRINLWAPASTWTDAYDARLQPVGTPQQNSSYEVLVDWVEVRTLP